VLTLVAGCGFGGDLPDAIIWKQVDDSNDPGTGGKDRGVAPPLDAGSVAVSVPGGAPGVGFDDMRFSAALAQLLVPAGRTGDLELVDPSSEQIATVDGFSSQATYAGNTSFGVTSADEGKGVIYATDRTSKMLARVEPGSRTITATLALASTPGYVRYVAPTSEVWISEPETSQIEIVSLDAHGGVALANAGSISVDGAESLEVDPLRGLAFTNSATHTIAIDVAKRAVAGTWTNGCTTARGLAVDVGRGWVIVGCSEGKLVVLDEQSGATLGAATTHTGVDRVAYDPSRGRVYVPSSTAAALDVLQVHSKGVPSLLGSLKAPTGTHCAVTPGAGNVFVCAPSLGQVVFVFDSL
jgi:hypothetical protein